MGQRKYSYLLILILFLFSCGSKSRKETTNKKEEERTTKIEIIKKQHDFGTVKIGDTVDGFFVIKNVGNTSLVYNKIISSCGCTLINRERNAVPTGEYDTLHFTLNTQNQNPGKFAKQIRIVTNTLPDLNRFIINAELQ